jgi:hypothetical protein
VPAPAQRYLKAAPLPLRLLRRRVREFVVLSGEVATASTMAVTICAADPSLLNATNITIWASRLAALVFALLYQ